MVIGKLKTAKLAGVLSEGMLLCAEDENGELSLMVPERKCRPEQRSAKRKRIYDFDSHAHYDDEAFDKDRDCLLSTLEEQGVGCIVKRRCKFFRGKRTVWSFSMRYPHVYAAVGVHPDGVGELDEVKMQHLREMCTMEKTVAVGEIGLDYYWDKESSRASEGMVQKADGACKRGRSSGHCDSREAAQDTFDLIKSEHAGTTGGVIHCFSGSKEMAKEYIKMGYYIGVGGVVTFKNARVLKEVVESIPLERILTETDCPYLAPVPFRGKRNCSAYISYVLDMIAELKGHFQRRRQSRLLTKMQRNMYRITD